MSLRANISRKSMYGLQFPLPYRWSTIFLKPAALATDVGDGDHLHVVLPEHAAQVVAAARRSPSPRG